MKFTRRSANALCNSCSMVMASPEKNSACTSYGNGTDASPRPDAEARNQELSRFINDLAFAVESAIQDYVGVVLSNSVYPDTFPVSYELAEGAVGGRPCGPCRGYV